MSETKKTPGQLAYEANVAASPTYHDGTPRRAWADLTDAIRDNWERHSVPKAQNPGRSLI